MLKPLATVENELMRMLHQQKTVKSICYASELMSHFNFSEDEMNEAIERAFKACYSLHIPIEENFRSVYRSDNDSAITDWRLSPLACYLLIINADPGNAEIAQLQLILATEKFDVNIF